MMQLHFTVYLLGLNVITIVTMHLTFLNFDFQSNLFICQIETDQVEIVTYKTFKRDKSKTILLYTKHRFSKFRSIVFTKYAIYLRRKTLKS